MSDVDKVKDHYTNREADPGLGGLYTPTNAGQQYMLWRRDMAVARALQRAGKFPLWDKRILDIGCGAGWQLRRFVELGADPAHCVGVDINPSRLERARYHNSHMTFLEANAERLPMEDGSFDIITQFVAFSSMPSNEMRQAAATEMVRLLGPDGLIIWYDFRIRKRGNSRVTAMPSAAVLRLFPSCSVRLHSETLAPPISRSVAPISQIACLVLEKIPWLRTHYLGVIATQ